MLSSSETPVSPPKLAPMNGVMYAWADAEDGTNRSSAAPSRTVAIDLIVASIPFARTGRAAVPDGFETAPDSRVGAAASGVNKRPALRMGRKDPAGRFQGC